MRKAFSLMFAVFFSFLTVHGQSPQEPTGSICTGIYIPVVMQEHELSRVYFTVDDSNKFYFGEPGKIALKDLDLHKTYAVRVFYDDKQIQKWNLRFDRMRANMVTIWRSAGYWHMDPTPSGKCLKP